MIKTFRGLLADGQQERIRLEHIDGKTGYRIKKFELMTNTPGLSNYESIVKVFSIKQTVIDGIVNFSEQTLLAAGVIKDTDSPAVTTTSLVTFDSVVFNQDIFVTHKDVDVGIACNYYLELEQISLDEMEATTVILKNFRNTNTVV